MFDSVKSIAVAANVSERSVQRCLSATGISRSDLKTMPDLGKFVLAHISPSYVLKLYKAYGRVEAMEQFDVVSEIKETSDEVELLCKAFALILNKRALTC